MNQIYQLQLPQIKKWNVILFMKCIILISLFSLSHNEKVSSTDSEMKHLRSQLKKLLKDQKIIKLLGRKGNKNLALVKEDDEKEEKVKEKGEDTEEEPEQDTDTEEATEIESEEQSTSQNSSEEVVQKDSSNNDIMEMLDNDSDNDNDANKDNEKENLSNEENNDSEEKPKTDTEESTDNLKIDEKESESSENSTTADGTEVSEDSTIEADTKPTPESEDAAESKVKDVDSADGEEVKEKDPTEPESSSDESDKSKKKKESCAANIKEQDCLEKKLKVKLVHLLSVFDSLHLSMEEVCESSETVCVKILDRIKEFENLRPNNNQGEMGLVLQNTLEETAKNVMDIATQELELNGEDNLHQLKQQVDEEKQRLKEGFEKELPKFEDEDQLRSQVLSLIHI